MEKWFTSERYARLLEAMRARNHPLHKQIVEAAIAETEGAEKAFWLLVRADFQVALNRDFLELALADIRRALQADPANPAVQQRVFINVLGLSYRTQRREIVLPFVYLIKSRALAGEQAAWVWTGLGHVHALRCQWRAAYRCLTLALEKIQRLPARGVPGLFGGRAALYGQRASVAIQLGNLEQAAADLEAVVPAQVGLPPSNISPLYFALVRAELAAAHGQFQEARRELQVGTMKQASGDYFLASPHTQTLVSLLAAKMARAEGNMQGFDHFCTEALSFAQRNALTLTEARIRAVWVGGEPL